MKKITLCRFAFCVSALGLLSGCAAFSTPEYTVDYAKVHAVESAADRFGTTVLWVNMPQKKIPASTSPASGTTGV